MENIKHLCRVCLGRGEINIFINSIVDRLMACSSIQIQWNDGYPENICSKCLSELENAFDFRQKCETSEKTLISFELPPVSKKNFRIIKVEDDSIDSTPVFCDDSKEPFQSTGLYENFLKNSLGSNRLNHLKTESNFFMKNKTVSNCITKKLNKNKSKNNHKKLLEAKSPITRKSIENDMNQSLKKSKSKERVKTRKHMCPICGKTFLFHGNLLDHERVHSGDKPFRCHICDRRFAQSGHLMIHARTHSGVKPYQCEVCPRAFIVSHALKKHLRIHTGERPYSCSMCDKSFVTSYHLSNHFKRHTGDKKFKCDWLDCGQGFVNISEMKRHRVKHEMIKPM